MLKIRTHHRLKLAVVLAGLLVAGLLSYYLVQNGLLGQSKPAQAANCTPDANLVNPCRPWYGAAVGKYTQVSSGTRAQMEYHEQRMGRKLDIVHTYHPVGSNQLSADDIYFANRANTYLFTNWKPTATWASAGGGNSSVNATIDKMANSIKSLGAKKIFLTVYHEPENDVSSGGQGCSATIRYAGSAGTPADYRAMWRNVYNRFNSLGVKNVVWVIDYMNYDPWDCLVDDLYPGNDIVDWVMFNAYGGGKTSSYSANVQHFYNLLRTTNSTAHDYLSKTWGIVEWNIRGATAAQEYSYYDQAKASVEKNEFPELKAYMVFDNVGPDGNENRVAYQDDGSYDTVKQDHYKAFANSTAFTSVTTPPVVTDTTPPTASLSAPADGATVSGTVTVTASASDDTGIAKVVFTIDGNVIGTDTTAPYSTAWDTKQVGNGGHIIRAKAYDSAGNAKTPQKTVTVANTTSSPAAPSITTFKASSAIVTVGERVTLTWSTKNSVNCSISPSGPQNTATFSWATPEYTATGTKQYSLTCKSAAAQSVTATLTVTVKASTSPPAKPVLSADKSAVTQGSNVLLSWSAARAASCILNPGNILSTGDTGSKLISRLNQTTTYTLECSNAAGKTSADPVTVKVATAVQATTPSILSFTATPTSLPGAGMSTLAWTTMNVASNGCNVVPGPLSSAPANGQWTTPQLTTSASFTLTCKDESAHNVSKSVAITVTGKPAPPAPVAKPTAVPATSDPIISSLGGQSIVNAQVNDTVTQGELVTLDPGNILDIQKIKSIVRVEYYDGEQLLQAVVAPPYALATKAVKPGTYTLTERVYYQDGSQSERTQNITVLAVEPAPTLLTTVIATGGAAVSAGALAGGLVFGRHWWLPGAKIYWGRLLRFAHLS